MGLAGWWWPASGWADGVRKLAERPMGGSPVGGFAVLDDPGYAQTLRLGVWFDDAAGAARTALEAAGGGKAACSGIARA